MCSIRFKFMLFFHWFLHLDFITITHRLSSSSSMLLFPIFFGFSAEWLNTHIFSLILFPAFECLFGTFNNLLWLSHFCLVEHQKGHKTPCMIFFSISRVMAKKIILHACKISLSFCAAAALTWKWPCKKVFFLF